MTPLYRHHSFSAVQLSVINFPNNLKKLAYFCLFLCLVGGVLPAQAANTRFMVLNYHDITERNVETDNATDVSEDHFEEQLAWLKQHAYHVVSVQQLVDAAAGNIELPQPAVVLSFDDGYASFYTKVFPLLKKYHLSATLALVGSWLDGQKPADVRQDLVNWAQVNEMQQSGLVEIASHSFSAHQGILANPQGNTQAAFVTRLYDPKTHTYETDSAYLQRLQAEMQQSSTFIFQHTGVRPRVMVWPYGEYNQWAITAAKAAGMPITMSLIDGDNSFADVAAIRRLFLMDNPNIKAFASIVTKFRGDRPLRVAHVDLDYLYDPDPIQTERNLDQAVKRIKEMHIDTVYLQAYADPDGDGNADALYFSNRHLPMQADLFNRVAWQFKRISGVRVYAWMPILAYQNHLPEAWYIKEWRAGKAQKSSHIYTRLSPFVPEARQYITEVYEDLAKNCNFDGLLFHDDGIMSDFEDAAPASLQFGHEVWGISAQFEQLNATPETRMTWAKHKTELINQFTDELANRVRFYRPGLKTARNFYTLPLLNPSSEEWFAQSFASFLKHYDYVAIEAMPFMEEAKEPLLWLKEVVAAVKKYPQGLDKTVFELQSVDWRSQQALPMSVFLEQLAVIEKSGAKHIGYYPDNVFTDQPRLEDLKKHFSLPELP